jgi:hypothetical protein
MLERFIKREIKKKDAKQFLQDGGRCCHMKCKVTRYLYLVTLMKWTLMKCGVTFG